MTFTQIQTEIAERVNLTSSTALDRIGREINDYYKRITTAIGLTTTRRETVQATMTSGVSTLTFTSTEKIIEVVDRSFTDRYRVLDEVSMVELRAQQPYGTGRPTQYAIAATGSTSVTIEVNCIPQDSDPVTLYADAYVTKATLSGSDVPAFAESFHDVLVLGVLSTEYRKLMKMDLAREHETLYRDRLSDLRYFIATSPTRDSYAGKTKAMRQQMAGATSGSGGTVDGSSSYEQTGLITFNRGTNAPFAVSNASAAKVTNLDADKLDGLDSTAFLLITGGNLTGDFSIATNKFTVASGTGNTAIAGTLGVTGATAITGDFAVNTNKFTVAAASGNTAIAGTLGVTGNVAVNTNKFTVDASSGNTLVAGALTVTGDVLTVADTDYSGTSTIVGFGSFTTKVVNYKKVGKRVFIDFQLEGTSNSTSTTFTVPYAPARTGYASLGRAVDNGSAVTTPTEIKLTASSTTITCYPSYGEGNWTNSGTKRVNGQFSYETA